MTTLEMENAALRNAVEERLAGCCEGQRSTPKAGWQAATQASAAKYAERLNGDGLLGEGLRPGSDAFVDVLEEIRQLHFRKTKDYGCDEDALSNIRNSADVINVPAYAGCVLRMSDKMHRLRSFFRRGEVEFDGIPDTLLDLAAYSIIALVLYREAQNA
jgi:hypothetical protein